ncbi:hypothetical protein C5167_043979 [Papaver somniferum]|uniref:Uncharacterized protein n=1 Tax=Papaver somniferum TaxID=3469 RepID=A0A4Y7L8V9_PAPSO|nr:hypothetical protein C5167_043979 [Papaver somniferum]
MDIFSLAVQDRFREKQAPMSDFCGTRKFGRQATKNLRFFKWVPRFALALPNISQQPPTKLSPTYARQEAPLLDLSKEERIRFHGYRWHHQMGRFHA